MYNLNPEVEFGVWLNPEVDAKFPTKAYEDDAGWDIYSIEDIIVPRCSRILVRTGVHLQLKSGWECQVRPRSGNAIKSGITVLNTPGTIDSSYIGEVQVILFNTARKDVLLQKHSKVAQLVFSRIPYIKLNSLSSRPVNETRGSNGFGSSGK
jgi:dUTP pyrophosphatase